MKAYTTGLFCAALFAGVSAGADSCFEVFIGAGSTASSLQCADNTYQANSSDFSIFIDLDGQDSSPFIAVHDGLTIFGGPDPNDAQPANLVPPFAAETLLTGQSNAFGVSEMRISHDGIAAFRSRDIAFQSLSFNSKGRAGFTVRRNGGGGGTASVTVHFEGTLLIQDDPVGGSEGASLIGVNIDLIPAGSSLFSGLADLDLDIAAVPSMTGDFTSHATATPSGTNAGSFEVSVTFTTNVLLTVDSDSAIDSEVYGNAFTDAHQSGDQSIWKVAALIPTRCTISSADPDVYFEVIPTSPPAIDTEEVVISNWQQTGLTTNNATFQVHWTSQSNETYRIQSSCDSQVWTNVPGSENIPSQGTQSTQTVTFDVTNKVNRLLRVLRL